jgi:hypothetical protein
MQHSVKLAVVIVNCYETHMVGTGSISRVQSRCLLSIVGEVLSTVCLQSAYPQDWDVLFCELSPPHRVRPSTMGKPAVPR